MNFDFEECLKLCLHSMRIVRTHPERIDPNRVIHPVQKSKPLLILYSISFCCYAISTYFITRHTYYNILEQDFFEACRTGVVSFVNVGAILNGIIMVYHRKAFKEVLDMMKNDFDDAKQLPLDEQKIVWKYIKKQKYICRLVFHITIISAGPFLGKALFLMVYYYFIGEPRIVIPYNLNYPDAIEERKFEFYMFFLLSSCLTLYSVYMAFNYVAFLPLGPALMMHACGRLELIIKSLDSLYDGELDKVNEKLKDIALKLQYTYNFVDIVKGCFELFLEASLNISSFMLPITFYQLIGSVKRGGFSVEVLSFVISSILMSSIPSYCSDMLLTKGEEVSTALYTCGWERNFDKKARKTILILLIRTSRPVALRTMFRTMCLDALTDVFQRAYAIFNLMCAVLD